MSAEYEKAPNSICCLFKGNSAVRAVKEWQCELVRDLTDSYRESRTLYRCKKCGSLVLCDYEETAHFLPGEDWDNAYVEEYYWSVAPDDYQTIDGEIVFDWDALMSRRYISAHYRELDKGEKPYCFVETKAPLTKAVRREYTKECPVTVTFDSLPADKDAFADICTFTELCQLDSSRILKVLLPNYDDPQEIRVEYKAESYSIELSFPMDEFGWTHQLVLAADGMEYKDVKQILTEICMNQISTEGIPAVIENFRDITSQLYSDSGSAD